MASISQKLKEVKTNDDQNLYDHLKKVVADLALNKQNV
jgi:hypothetical protein